MSSWDVARLTVRLGDHNIRVNSEVKHVERKVKRVVRHRGKLFSRRIMFLYIEYRIPIYRFINKKNSKSSSLLSGFDSRTLYNDIAILTLDQKVPFSKGIKPVCLPAPGSRQFSGLTATVVGWGSLRENGPQPSVLQEVTLPIWTNSECKQKYGPAGELELKIKCISG